MRRIAVASAAALVASLMVWGSVATQAEAAPRRGRGRPAGVPNPLDTLNRLKRAVGRRDASGEWAVLSPGFKQRLNARVGRTVDLADYTHVRQMHRRNGQVRQAEGALKQSSITRVRYGSPRRGYARVTIWFQGPLVFGKQETVTMVLLRRWEVWVQGENQPYWGFANDPSMGMQKLPDGRVHLWSRSPAGKVTWQEVIPANRVRSVTSNVAWYFDHLGQLESFFG